MPTIDIFTKNVGETKKVAALLAEEIVSVKYRRGAVVIALEGELGGGKTTFTQGFARALGVQENILSPTFVILKIYDLMDNRTSYKHLVHIDCYRLESPKELLYLGFKNLLQDKDAIILIEWADRIKKFIPPHSFWIKFRYGEDRKERIIRLTIKDQKRRRQSK